jgi:hypothetical protein
MRCLLASLAVLCVLGATPAGAATAPVVSPWTLTNLELGGEETLFGISCEPSGFCVGVGQQGVMVTSSAPTAGAAAWTISHLTLGEKLKGNLRGVSCPSSSLCVAVDYSGGIWTTTEPAAGAAAWTQTTIPKARSLFGVSCSSPTLCVVVGYEGTVITSTNPTGGADDWTTVHLPEPLQLHAVACTANGGTLCVASGFEGRIVVATDPTAGAAAWTTPVQPAGENPLLGVSCFSVGLCAAGNAGGVMVSSLPTAGAWAPGPLPARFQILGASCPAAGLCVLSSNNGEVSATTTPASGGWATEHLIKGTTNALFGLSCPSEALCVAGGKFGQLLTTTAPALTGHPPPPPPVPPGTRVLHRPPATITVGYRHRGPVAVAFRFAATGTAPPYFRCQLGGRPSGLCTSPRRVRVGVGRHVFRMRAFNAGGGDPTPAIVRFRVVKLKPPQRKSHLQAAR